MKKVLSPGPTPKAYDAEALYIKAQRFVQQMSEFDSDSSEHALWSSLSLELLARAALANISPALLAESEKNWSSLYYALGFSPSDEKFAPKSIAISEVFKRLSAILPNFATEHESFGILHTGRRNAELHSGDVAFEGIKGSVWQPRFYQVSEILLVSMGMTLADFVGDEDAKIAQKLISAALDESAKAVRSEIDAHKKVWSAKDEKERETQSTQAAAWAARYIGHRVTCPACTSRALVHGEPVSAPTKKLYDDEIVETQEYLPSQFQCVACGLKIAGLSRLTAAGLGDRYKKTTTFDAAEYYAPEDTFPEYEEDNNEP